MDSKMAKQAILLLILSVIAMFLQNQLAQVLVFLLHLHNIIVDALSRLTVHFGSVGVIVQGIVALIILPLVVGFIVTGLYWLVKHMTMPYTMSVIWIVWLILLISILAQGSRV